MVWLLLVAACTETPTSGHLFEPVAEAAPASAAPRGVDPRFAAPAEAPFRISSEELAKNATSAEPGSGTAGEQMAPSDAAIAGGSPSSGERMAAPGNVSVAAPPLAAVASSALFPVRLVSTIPQAQPPRAVIGLADGSEVVVSPGSVLGPQGLVVMAVMEGRVQLARVQAAGDHAVIESVELTAQYH